MSSYRRRLLLANQSEENLILYGNSVQDGTPVPDAPIDIMSVENPTIKVTGKNLIPYPYFFSSGTYKEVEVLINNDGTIVLNGTAIGNAYLNISNKDFGNTAFYSGKSANGFVMSGCPEGANSNLYYNSNNKVLSFSITNGKTYNNYIIKPMVEIGTTPSEYEPYKEELIEVKGYTLRGIGNYKDRIYTKDGKVWFEQSIFNYIPTKAYSVAANKVSADMFPTFGSKYKPLGLNGSYMQTSSNAMNNAFKYNVSFAVTAEPHWFIGYDSAYKKTNITLVRPVGSEEWADTTIAWKWLTDTLGDIKWEIQYVLETPLITEITGSLAEKILAIDKSKNITITSANGVSGRVEVIEE